MYLYYVAGNQRLQSHWESLLQFVMHIGQSTADILRVIQHLLKNEILFCDAHRTINRGHFT